MPRIVPNDDTVVEFERKLAKELDAIHDTLSNYLAYHWCEEQGYRYVPESRRKLLRKRLRKLEQLCDDVVLTLSESEQDDL